jgi:hypothetical protein
MRLLPAFIGVAAMGLVIQALAQEPKMKDKQEPAAGTADSQQGFSFDYCRELLAKTKGASDPLVDTNETKIRNCMTTGKIE